MENNKINEGALTKQIKTLVMQERYEEAMKELDEIDVSTLTPIDALNTIYRLQNRLRNRWGNS